MKATRRETPESVTREKTKPDAEKRKKVSEEQTEQEVTGLTDRPDRGWPERSDEDVIGRPIQLDHDPLDRHSGGRGERDPRRGGPDE